MKTQNCKFSLFQKKGFLVFLFFQSFSVFSNPNEFRTTIEYTSSYDKISEQKKEEVWIDFLRLKEGNWMKIHFNNPNNYEKSSTFSDCKKFSNEMASFFVKRGLTSENVVIKYAPQAYLLVYKKPGIGKNANFISLPKSWLQTFILSNLKGGICNTKNGHQIVFPPKSFQVVNGDQVLIELYEIDSKKSFVLSGYTASSNDRLLESNGMFKINISQDKKPINLRQGVVPEIRYKTADFVNEQEKTSYNTFYGKETKDEIDWIPNYSQKISSSDPLKSIPIAKGKYSSTLTETYFVQLNRKLSLLETSISIQKSNGVLSEQEYNFLLNKYGVLQFEEKGKLSEIKNYQSYKSLIASNKDLVFIGLSPEQHEQLKGAESAKKQKDLEQKQKEEKERAIREAEEAKAIALENSHPISMKINELGNINCDRFFDVKEKANVIVKLDDLNYDKIKVYTIFSDIKSVIHGTYLPGDKGHISFNNLPEGKNVIYLAAIFNGTQVKMAYISKPIQKDDIVEMTLKSYTEKQYESILNDLIPN